MISEQINKQLHKVQRYMRGIIARGELYTPCLSFPAQQSLDLVLIETVQVLKVEYLEGGNKYVDIYSGTFLTLT